MTRTLTLLLAVACTIGSVQAQEHIKTFSWPETATYDSVPEHLSGENYVMLKDLRVYEYSTENDEFWEYALVHRKVWVNSEEAIDQFNKVYISMRNTADMVESYGRVISPSGEETLLKESDIITSEEMGSFGAMKYFAMEGIETGSQIEYFYIVKNYPNVDGRQLLFQSDDWRLDVDFHLACPNALGFAFLNLNGFPEVVLDSNLEEYNLYTAHLDSIPPLYEEDFAAYDANRQGVVYKMEHIYSARKYNIVNYGTISQNIHENVNRMATSSDLKKLEKLLKKEIQLDQYDTEVKKIRALEDYIKLNFSVYDEAGDASVAHALQTKVTSETGMLVLFTHMLKLAGIKYEIGATCNRFELRFDEKFESDLFLQGYFLYFPKHKLYLSPADMEYRLGFIPEGYTHTNGLFIKTTKVGDFETVVGKIKFIEAVPAEKNQNIIEATVDLSEDLLEPVIAFKRAFSGYTAFSIQPVYRFLDEEDKKSVDEAFGKLTGSGATLLEYEVKNTEPENIGNDPFVIEGELKDESLLEKAGNTYLFHIGMLIGEQAEMYQENERQLPVENGHNRTYKRTLTVTIPEGYSVTNADDLNVRVADEDETCLFSSTYTWKDDRTLEVVVDEYYKQISYPLEAFEAYQKVINAAADFNKIALILKPS